MILTYIEALEQWGTLHYLRKAVAEGKILHVAHNTYSTSENYDVMDALLKKYSGHILTGATAYYIHGLTDVIPDMIDLASKQNSTKISDPHIQQYFIPEEWLNIGKTTTVHDGTSVTIYDQERMLLELARNKNKLPYDVYKEVVASYRKRADSLDIYKLQDYAERMPRGNSYLKTVMKEVF